MRSNQDTPPTSVRAEFPLGSPDADPAIQQAFMARRAQRLATTPDPDFPASGTEMVAARLAAARTQRDAAPWIPA